MAAHQAPPSLGFSRQEHWSGLPFPSPVHESEKWKLRSSILIYTRDASSFESVPPKSRRIGSLTRSSVLGKHWPCYSPARLLLIALHMQPALGEMVPISPQSSNTSSFPLFRLEDPSSFQKVLSPVGVNSWLHWEAGLWKSVIAPQHLLGIVVIFSQSSVPGDTECS